MAMKSLHTDITSLLTCKSMRNHRRQRENQYRLVEGSGRINAVHRLWMLITPARTPLVALTLSLSSVACKNELCARCPLNGFSGPVGVSAIAWITLIRGKLENREVEILSQALLKPKQAAY